MADRDPWLPERLAAAVLVVKAERQVEAAVVEAIQEWLQRVRALVLGDAPTVTAAGPPDLGGFAAADGNWLTAVRALLLPTLSELFGERFRAHARNAVVSDQPYRDRYIEEVFSRLKLFPAQLFEEIRPEIAEALAEGDGIDDIRDRISAVLDFDTTRGAAGEQALTRRLRADINAIERELQADDLPPAQRKALRAERSKLYPQMYRAERQWQWKSRRIARTEVMGALNGGSHAGALARAEIGGATLYKQWLANTDERTRPTHQRANGQIRPIAEPFDVGAANLQFPGDPTGPPHEIIQCRCTPLYLDEAEVEAIEARGVPVDIRRAQPAGPVEQPGAGQGQSSIDEPPTPTGALPEDLTTVADEELAAAASAAFEVGDDTTAERVIAELDRRDQIDQRALAAADEAVAAAADAPAPEAATGQVDDAWNNLGDAWGDDPAPWAHDGADPEPVSDGPGYRYDDATDEIHEDPDVPGGWVMAEDPHTGARSFYEAAGMEKPARLTTAAADAAREAYSDWVELQYLAADDVTRGNLLSKAGVAAGVHPRELFSGTARRARKYASEELLRFWQEHPRMTQVEYLFQATGDERYRAAAVKARENNAKALVSFALVAAAKKKRRRKGRRRGMYTRLHLVRAYWAGRDAALDDPAPAGVDACPYTPAAHGVLALLWVRGFNDNRPDPLTAGGDMTEQPEALPNGWRGHIALLDGPTGDGRLLATPPDGVRLRQPPRPVQYQEVMAPGHDGAVVAGRVDRVWVEGDRLWGEGPFNLASENGRKAAASLRDGMSNGVSADPDDVTWTEKFVDAGGAEVDVEGLDEDAFWEGMDAGQIKPLMVMTDWRLMGATMVAFQAFDEASLEALYDYVSDDAAQQQGGPIDASALVASVTGATDLPVADRGHAWDGAAAVGRVFDHYTDGDTVDTAGVARAFLWRDADADPATKGAYKLPFADVVNGELQIIPAGVAATAGGRGVSAVQGISDTERNAIQAKICTLYGKVRAEHDDWPDCPFNDSMQAAGVLAVDDPVNPAALLKPAPAEHFTDPQLDRHTPLTVTDDGRIFGHIAPWNQCHIGDPTMCTVAPPSHTGYAHFHLGEVITTEGRLPVGTLTLGGGHADEHLGYRAATEHYDDAGKAVAAIRAGEDKHGIWVAGRLLSTVTAEQVELLLLCPPSGDWRRIGGHLEMVAVHSVNTPGFGIVRTVAASAGGVQISLVAAGHRTMRRAYRDRARRQPAGGGLDYRRLAAELAREQREYAARQARSARLAARIGRDPATRAAAAAARIGLPV